jgi:hypothetical protein
MSTRPTREQIEAARNFLTAGSACLELTAVMGSDAGAALRTLLAATAEPTDEELAEEARRHFGPEPKPGPTRGSQDFRARVYGYVLGARREGAR